jgi:hypothetical protein
MRPKVLEVAGGVAVAGDAVMWFVPKSKHRETASAVPIVTGHHAGLAFIRRF